MFNMQLRHFCEKSEFFIICKSFAVCVIRKKMKKDVNFLYFAANDRARRVI